MAPPGSGLTLYPDLLDPPPATSTSGTDPSAPEKVESPAKNAATDKAAAGKPQFNAAYLRFQPRPQGPTQKPKMKLPSQVAVRSTNQLSTEQSTSSRNEATTVISKPPVMNNLARWVSEPDVDDANTVYGAEKRHRGGRKNKKKHQAPVQVALTWDDIYDPLRPTLYEDYPHSDENIAELRAWKDKLHASQMAQLHSTDSDSNNGDVSNSESNVRFPPPGLSFAPPSSYEPSSKPAEQISSPEKQPGYHPESDHEKQSDYVGNNQIQPRPSETDQPLTQTNPPTLAIASPSSAEQSRGFSQVFPSLPSSTGNNTSSQISRAPVRYNLPAPSSDIPQTETELDQDLQMEDSGADDLNQDDEPRSLRPGQKDFAQRLMSKQGWTKGMGLGASGTGILNPLQVKVEKQKRKPDSEGGGFDVRAGRGTIIGDKKRKVDSQAGKFGEMSEVVILKGMFDGTETDLEGNAELLQEIGEECGEKYGRVERVFIHRSNTDVFVFVKFTSQLSALRAVSALEGKTFHGKQISARFFDAEKFDKGEYD
ncbi:MAG: hypothetical protein LQ351_004789 [Letrouitia transgressa]|nr:MAG: hypothetical protein LQ351_004789 [Letrouitia transgressa]